MELLEATVRQRLDFNLYMLGKDVSIYISNIPLSASIDIG